MNPNLPAIKTPAFGNPFRELAEGEVPCFKVALMSGKAERVNNRIEYAHSDTLVVAYIFEANEDDLENALYAAGEEILDFLIKDENNSADADSIHHLVSDLIFSEWSMDLKNGATGTGAIVLKFDLSYHTTHELSFGALEGFEVTIKHTDAGDDTDPVAVDSIDVPTE